MIWLLELDKVPREAKGVVAEAVKCATFAAHAVQAVEKDLIARKVEYPGSQQPFLEAPCSSEKRIVVQEEVDSKLPVK